MTVQIFMEIVWTTFEKFEIFMKRSKEKKTKKRNDWSSSRKFFPTPKNWLTIDTTRSWEGKNNQQQEKRSRSGN